MNVPTSLDVVVNECRNRGFAVLLEGVLQAMSGLRDFGPEFNQDRERRLLVLA